MKFPCIDHDKVGNKLGYAMVYVGNYKSVHLHRQVFEYAYGYSPEVVLHICDNPRCINPLHLKGGTHADNMADCARKGRRSQYLRKLTPQDVRDIRVSKQSAIQLAKQYGVSQSTVLRVIHHKVYKEV